MKVVFINRFFFPDHSATSQLLTDLAFFLAEHGHAVSVITSRQGYDDVARVMPQQETIRGVQVYRVWGTRYGRSRLLGRILDYFSFYVSATWRLSRLAHAGDVVVVKTDPPLMGVPASFVCAAKQARLVNWLQDLFPEVAEAAGIRGIRGGTAAWLRRLRNRSIQRSVATVAIGERMRARLIEEGVSAGQLVVIPNWADGDCAADARSSDSELRKAWGLEDKFVVGYSGNAGRVHDLATVVDAMELLKSNHEIAFLFVGGGKHRDWLESEVRRRGIENIQFQPYQPREHLMSSLRVADVHLVTLMPAMEGLVVPSKFYGVAAAGRPTLFVGDADGEIAQIVIDAACGVVVSSGDAVALARAILTLRGQPELLAWHGRNARAAFEARFDKKHALSRWQGLIECVASGKPMK